jgi:MFS family permease
VMGGLSLGLAEKLMMGIGPRSALLAGLGLIVAGLLLFARTPVDGSYVIDVLPAMLLLGGGAGLSFPALMTLAMSGATPQDSGLASGFINTTVQVGGAVGLAVLATLSTERSERLLADGENAASALNSGYHLAYLIGAVLTVVAIVVAFVVLRSQKAEPAEEPAHEPSPEPSRPELALTEAA